MTLLINPGLRGALRDVALTCLRQMSESAYAPVKRMQTMAGIMMLKRVAGSVLVVCALGLAGCSTPAGPRAARQRSPAFLQLQRQRRNLARRMMG